MKFDGLKKGMKVRVCTVKGCTQDCVRLQEMGLTVGTCFSVVKVAPLGDPIEIDVRGYRLCLRKRETTDFEVEPVA